MNEEKISKEMFTTGEFAKLCNVKKQTLFHYDHIGILKPDIIGSNGYRYYSYLQLDTFNTISMLKELDMPLSDIKNYLNKRNPDDFLKLLHRQREIVDEKLSEILWLKSFIDRRIQITTEGITAIHNKIYIEERPEEYYIITEYKGGTEERNIYEAIAAHLSFCHENQIYSPYAIGALVPSDDDFSDESDYNYSHFYTRIEPVDADINDSVTVIPARKCAVICSTKGYDDAPAMYRRLLTYTKKNGYEAGSHFFEDILLDNMSSFSYDDHTLKLSIPVK